MQDCLSKVQVKTTSLKNIAKLAKTSITTVSKVLNNTSGTVVSAQKRELILKISKELNYRPNRSARFFAKGKTGSIAVVLPHDIFSDFAWRATVSLSLEIYEGIINYLSSKNYIATLLFSPKENVSDFLRKELLEEQKIDGVILFSGEEELAMGKEFEKAGIPCISFDWRSPRFGINCIDEDPGMGISQAVQNIKELGHTEVGCIYFKDEAKAKHVLQRKDFFISECKQNGLKVVEKFCAEAIDETDSYLKTYKLFSGKKHPTVMFYTSDLFAMLGIRALHELGLKIPDDVSIIGCDDALFSADCPVSLSTIKLPRQTKGQVGAEVLMRMINKKSVVSTSSIKLHSEFIRRDSVGIAKVNNN